MKIWLLIVTMFALVKANVEITDDDDDDVFSAGIIDDLEISEADSSQN